MSHIIPYISSEPPPIQNDSFDGDLEESDLSKSHISIPKDVPALTEKEICDESQSKTKPDSDFIISDNISNLDNLNNFQQLKMNNSIENKNCIDINDEILSQCSDQNEFDNEIELELNIASNIPNIDTEYKYDTYREDEESKDIEEFHGDEVDHKDGIEVNVPNDSVHEILSQCSNEDQFSDELDEFFGYKQDNSNKNEGMDCEDTIDKTGDKKANDNFFHNNFDNVKENEDDFADFNQADFPSFDMIDHNTTGVVIAKETNEKDDVIDKKDDEFDDFTDFSTFQTVRDEEILNSTKHEAKVNLNELLETFNDLISTIEINQEEHSQLREINKFDQLFEYNKDSEEIWRELINFDYSPAFQFQWMQSRLCEKFMSSLGEEYLEILQSHKATLPIYSVNLTPIEPVPFICPSNNNTSASPQSNSNLDLTQTFGKDQSPATQSSHSSNQTIDFKNLEEEFACESKSSEFVTVSHNLSDFNNASSLQTNTANTNDVIHTNNLDNLSTDVFIQSESFGGNIIKSLLKPLSNTNINSAAGVTNNNINKASPMTSSALVHQLHPQSQAIIRDLPDLSYMTSKVLMFPVLSTCESTEDNL